MTSEEAPCGSRCIAPNTCAMKGCVLDVKPATPKNARSSAEAVRRAGAHTALCVKGTECPFRDPRSWEVWLAREEADDAHGA